MAEYIDRKAAIEAMEDLTLAKEVLESIPAADVAGVVRCRDCKYWGQRSEREYGLCNRHRGVWLNSDYCSKGERKDGGQDNG